MSLLITSENNCFTAPVVINSKSVATISSWEKSSLPTQENLLHAPFIRIPIHTFAAQNRTQIYEITLTWVNNSQDQYLQLSSAKGNIDLDAITPFISGILQEKKNYIFNIYQLLYTGS
jgi:hypothetical protein